MRLIDADELKEYIHNQDGRPFIGITIGEAFQMMVDEQPTIEERKTGNWIHTDTQAGYDINGDLVWADMMKCETCGFEICTIQEQYNYCPNCGADMRKTT